MVNLLLLFLLVPAAFSYTEDIYPSSANDEGEQQYLYMDTRRDKPGTKSETTSGVKSLRSTYDKNSIRLGRSDLPPLLDVDNEIDTDDYMRPARYDKNTGFMRFGRDKSNFVRFGRGSNFMRFGRGNSDFVRFGRGNRDFLRFGRNGRSGFLRFGRDSADAKQTRSHGLSFMRFGRMPSDTDESGHTRNKREVFDSPYKKHSSNFLRFGRDGDFGQDTEVNEEADQGESLNHNSPLVQLLTDLDCTIDQDNAICARLA